MDGDDTPLQTVNDGGAEFPQEEPPSTLRNGMRIAFLVIVGQFLSCMLTGTGVFSQILVNNGVSIPNLQSLISYSLLLFVFVPLHVIRVMRGTHRWMSTNWYYYVIAAIADVEANYFAVKAYKFTSITSVQLLDCFSIPCVVVLTKVLMRNVYSWSQYGAIAGCMIGMGLLLLDDYLARTRAAASNPTTASSAPLLGDAFCLLAAFCYALSNVAQESLLKRGRVSVAQALTSCTQRCRTRAHQDVTNTDRASMRSEECMESPPPPPSDTVVQDFVPPVEFLAFLGVFGCALSCTQLLLFEYDEVHAFQLAETPVLCLCGFGICMLLLYSIVPRFLLMSGSTFLNLSFLSADFFSVIAGTLLFSLSLDELYFVAFAIIIIGLVVYHANMNYGKWIAFISKLRS